VSADEALRMGLVNYVYPDDEFRAKAREYADQIANAAPLSVRYIKRLVYQGLNADLLSHLDTLSSHIALVRTSNDHKEAVAAAKEKRAPKFSGT